MWEGVYEERSDGKEWKKESYGKDGRKSGRNKNGVLPYVSTSLFPPLVIMNMQITSFLIFNLLLC